MRTLLTMKLLPPVAVTRGGDRHLRRRTLDVLNHRTWIPRREFLSTVPNSDDDETELAEFTRYLDRLKDHEKSGVPAGAGNDSEDGFDLGRMRRLMTSLGNPQSKFKAVHIAGTKGKGSTAAFLSNILRAEGYSIGCYTSPHIRSIRERMTVGSLPGPVSAKALNFHFKRARVVLDQAIELENGHISHFEVLTAMAFYVFAEENVDIAVIEAGLGGARDATNIISSSELAASVITTIGEEHLAALGGSLESIAVAKSGIIKAGRPVVLCGPYLPHIECILRDKASSMCSPVVSASDPGNRSIIKGTNSASGKPIQLCDIVLKIEKDLPLCLELLDLNMHMIGSHQLQNAATAACVALCLRNQGWRISDESIRAGLESTYLLGRGQFLTSGEVEALGLPGATIILDGAHTKESAKSLVNTIEMAFPGSRLVFVVAMAMDKDHVAFARELLSARQVEAVLLTEVGIGGCRSRTTPLPRLKDSWVRASKEVGRDILELTIANCCDWLRNQSEEMLKSLTLLFAEKSLIGCMRVGNEILRSKARDQLGIIVVTGSLHIVSSVLSSMKD